MWRDSCPDEQVTKRSESRLNITTGFKIYLNDLKNVLPPYQVIVCVRYFLSNFSSHQMIALQKLFYLMWKAHFVLEISSPLFLPVSHCSRGWWKINLKDWDIINCLNKNLIKHFIWYLKKEKRYGIETLSIDRVLNKEHFYWKIMQKMCTRGYSQTPF